jgi:hypothetical protein
LEGQTLVLRTAMVRLCDELLELAEHDPLHEWVIGVWASLAEGPDQGREDCLALLAVEPQKVAQGIHDGIDAAEPIEVTLPVTAHPPRHQLARGTMPFVSGSGGAGPSTFWSADKPL